MSDGWKATLSQSEIDSCALHRGFFGQYAAVAAAVREEIEKAADLLDKKHQLIVCGHSMGGALANICHFDLLASGLAKTESTGLVTIGSGPAGTSQTSLLPSNTDDLESHRPNHDAPHRDAGNSWFADVHDKLTRIEEDARRHLHIVNNNDPVPAAALGVEDGGSICCIVAIGDGEAYEHSGTMIWMDRIPGKFRERVIGMLGGLARVARRLVSPCTACCFHGTNVGVADHSTENYVTKMAEHLSARFGTPMRCLSS
jgi:pimeloyl-ACP methyl ester carboxylesterase